MHTHIYIKNVSNELNVFFFSHSHTKLIVLLHSYNTWICLLKCFLQISSLVYLFLLSHIYLKRNIYFTFKMESHYNLP